MCLGVPGRVTRWLERESPFAEAEVEFGGVRRRVGMDCVLEAEPGDFVIVHAGMAISLLDAQEAEELLATLRAIGGDESPESPHPTESTP